MKKRLIVGLFFILFVMCLGGCASVQLKNKDEATKLSKHGMEAYLQGRYQDALSYFEKSLKITRQLNNSAGISINLNGIGLVYFSLHRYDEALSYFEEALKIRKKLNNPLGIAMSLNNIGNIYASLNHYDKAFSYCKEALKISRQLNSPKNIASSLNNIGNIYSSLGHYDKALSYYEEALKIDKSQFTIGMYLVGIGHTYLLQKKYEEAEKLFIEGHKELERARGLKLRNPLLVEVYLATGRYNEALKLLKDWTPGWNDDDHTLIRYYTQHGFALKGNGSFKEASSEFLKAITLTEEMRQKVKGEKSGFLGAGGVVSRIRAYRGLFSTLAERAISRQEDNPLNPPLLRGTSVDKEFAPYWKDIASASFYFAESTKGRTLLEAMAESAKKSQRVELPEEIREKEQSILNQLSAIENQWDDAYKRGEDVLRRLKERKDGLNAELNNLITELRQKYSRYAALNYPKPVPPEELPLKEDEVLLEYAIGDDAAYLFVVSGSAGSSRGVKRLIKIPLSREEIEAKVKAFIEPMNTKQIERFSVKEAKELYEILLAEAMKEVTPSP